MKNTLRALIEKPGIKVAPAVYDCLGALIAEQAGFEFVFEGKRVIPVQELVEKIRAAVYARGESNLVIVGRTDARAIEGLQGASARGERYLGAGADILFIEARRSHGTN